MATPGWVRDFRRTNHLELKLIRTDLQRQALEHVEIRDVDEVPETWIPRQGMSFADGT